MREAFSNARGASGSVCRKQFTLNELLAVLLILMLLFSLVVPTLSEIRVMYMQSACSDNLMALSKASLMYLDDNGSYVPAAASPTQRWHGALREDPAKRPDFLKSPLRVYFKGKHGMRPCPLFEEVCDASAPAPEKGGFGYGYNENIGSLRAVQQDFDYWDPQCKESGVMPSEVPFPRSTVMFAETATRADAQGQRDLSGKLAENSFCVSYDVYNRGRPMWGSPAPTVNFRHAGRSLVSWCDGHLSSESPGGTKSGWGASSIGYLGTRTRSAFVPKTPPREELAP